MFKLLEKIRSLPHGHRNIIAFGTSLSVCGVIFVFWIVSWKYTADSIVTSDQTAQAIQSRDGSQLGSGGQVTQTQQDSIPVATPITPGQTISSALSQSWDTIVTSIADLKNIGQTLQSSVHMNTNTTMHYSATNTPPLVGQ